MTPLSPSPSVLSISKSNQSEIYLGSLNNPWTVYVDLCYPERNLTFDIVQVPRIEFSGWAREGIDICTEVGIDDAKFWNAWMVLECKEEYNGRVVMIRGKT